MAQPQQSYNFRGKKAIVTGGSKGIGLDIVGALAKANIEKVYVLARSQTALDAVKAKFKCVETISVDLGNWAATRKAVEKIEPVDFLVNNAGFAMQRTFWDITEDVLNQLLDVNLKGVINVSQVVCKKMKEKGGGVVVNISTLASQKPVDYFMAYGASKAALDAVTRQMAYEVGPSIRVNAINPGLVMTDEAKGQMANEHGQKMVEAMMQRTPLKRFAELGDVTGPVMFLLSDASAMIDGQCIPVCGGFAIC